MLYVENKKLFLLTQEILPDSETVLTFFLVSDREEGERERVREYLHVCANETVTICSNLSLTDGFSGTLRTLRTVPCVLLHALLFLLSLVSELGNRGHNPVYLKLSSSIFSTQ
jgi:hypothetical protein